LFQASGAFVLILAAIAVCGGAVEAQEPAVQVIELTARKYEFSPSPYIVRLERKFN